MLTTPGFAIGINRAGVAFHRTDEPEEVVVPEIVVMMAIDKLMKVKSNYSILIRIISRSRSR